MTLFCVMCIRTREFKEDVHSMIQKSMPLVSSSRVEEKIKIIEVIEIEIQIGRNGRDRSVLETGFDHRLVLCTTGGQKTISMTEEDAQDLRDFLNAKETGTFALTNGAVFVFHPTGKLEFTCDEYHGIFDESLKGKKGKNSIHE